MADPIEVGEKRKSTHSRLPRREGEQVTKEGREGQEKIRRVKWSFVIDISRKLLFPQREYYSRVNEFGFDISIK